jgi:hypothetical protein
MNEDAPASLTPELGKMGEEVIPICERPAVGRYFVVEWIGGHAVFCLMLYDMM